MKTDRLYWWCGHCGTPTVAQAEYALGDKEPCCLCSEGTAVVMTWFKVQEQKKQQRRKGRRSRARARKKQAKREGTL